MMYVKLLYIPDPSQALFLNCIVRSFVWCRIFVFVERSAAAQMKTSMLLLVQLSVASTNGLRMCWSADTKNCFEGLGSNSVKFWISKKKFTVFCNNYTDVAG